MTILKQTPLYEVHMEYSAKMVDFEGYTMPLQYKSGIMQEHLHTRKKAGLFDISHMGPAYLKSKDIAKKFEKLVTANIEKIKTGKTKYTVITNKSGGIIDDIMVSKIDDETLYIVANSGSKEKDFIYIKNNIPEAELIRLDDNALIALQGPSAENALEKLVTGVKNMQFMTIAEYNYKDTKILVSRSGYTGEDGYEVLVPKSHAISLTSDLLKDPDVLLIGLGARDSLRLEAGLCLYGNDIDETTSPIEANIAFVIGKSRLEKLDFEGAERIVKEIKEYPSKKLVGISIDGKLPARQGAKILDEKNNEIGIITSGLYSPSLEKPIALGYIDYKYKNTQLNILVRKNILKGNITELPFIKKNYKH